MFQDKGPQGAKLFDPKRSEEYQGGGDAGGLSNEFTNAAYREAEEARKAKIVEIEARLTEEKDSEKIKILEAQLAELQHPVDKYLNKLKEKRNEIGIDDKKAA